MTRMTSGLTTVIQAIKVPVVTEKVQKQNEAWLGFLQRLNIEEKKVDDEFGGKAIEWRFTFQPCNLLCQLCYPSEALRQCKLLLSDGFWLDEKCIIVMSSIVHWLVKGWTQLSTFNIIEFMLFPSRTTDKSIPPSAIGFLRKFSALVDKGNVEAALMLAEMYLPSLGDSHRASILFCQKERRRMQDDSRAVSNT